MNRDTFWKIIDECRNEVEYIEEFGDSLSTRLEQLEPEEIASFAENLSELMLESYRHDLWAIGYIVNGGCSDDGFEYFRGWLIANGKERFEKALANPKSIGDFADAESCENECEDIFYSAITAYQNKTGEFPPKHPFPQYPDEPAGESWEEEQLETLYPQLCEKFFDNSDTN